MISGTRFRNISFAKIWVSGFARTVWNPVNRWRGKGETKIAISHLILSLRKSSSYLTTSLIFLTWKSSSRCLNFQLYWVWFFTMVIFWFSFLQHKFLLTQIFSIKTLEAKNTKKLISMDKLCGQTVWRNRFSVQDLHHIRKELPAYSGTDQSLEVVLVGYQHHH